MSSVILITWYISTDIDLVTFDLIALYIYVIDAYKLFSAVLTFKIYIEGSIIEISKIEYLV